MTQKIIDLRGKLAKRQFKPAAKFQLYQIVTVIQTSEIDEHLKNKEGGIVARDLMTRYNKYWVYDVEFSALKEVWPFQKWQLEATSGMVKILQPFPKN